MAVAVVVVVVVVAAAVVEAAIVVRICQHELSKPTEDTVKASDFRNLSTRSRLALLRHQVTRNSN